MNRQHVQRRWVIRMLMSIAPSAAIAQSGTIAAAPFAGRSIAGLIDSLPGRAVPLSQLLSIALKDGFAMRVALTSRRLAEANALSEGRATDPTLRFGSGVASSGEGAPVVRTSVAGIESALRWGTELGLDVIRRSGADTAGVSLASGRSALSLSVSQPLLDGLNQRTAEVRATRLERNAAIDAFNRTAQQVISDIELQYWSLSEAQATEAVYQRSLVLSQTLLSRNAELAARDLVAQVDVLTARSGVALRLATVIQARQARRDVSDQLIVAVFGERAAEQLLDDSLPLKTVATSDSLLMAQGALMDLASATRISLANRLDVRAAVAARDAAKVRLDRARNATRPSLSLDGGWSATQSDAVTSPLGRAPGSTSNGWRLGVSLSAPVRNRGDQGQALLAAAVLELQEVLLRSVEAQVRIDVRATERAMRTGRERLTAADDAASLAWDQLVAERRRLDLGLGDSFRLLQTEENAVQAQLEAVRARYDLARAHTRYRLAIGASAAAR